MNKYNINGTIVSTNLSRNRIYEISNPVISYPYPFTNKIRKIKQKFITGSNNIPAYNPLLTHPTYNQAYIISQTEAVIDSVGFAEFTREYIEFLDTDIFTNPSTLTFTYPRLWSGTAYWIRTGNTQAFNIADYKPLRDTTLTEVVSVSEKWELINVGNEIVDTETALEDIPLGSSIGYAGFRWVVIANTGFGLDLERVDEQGETIGISISSGFTYYNSQPNFDKLSKVEPFTVYDTFYDSDTSSYLQSLGYAEMPIRRKVNFVDDATEPDIETYLADVTSKKKFPLAESKFTHLGGYVYIRKTLYGKLK